MHKLEEKLAGLTVSLSVFEKVSLLEKLKVVQLVGMKESLRDFLTTESPWSKRRLFGRL